MVYLKGDITRFFQLYHKVFAFIMLQRVIKVKGIMCGVQDILFCLCVARRQDSFGVMGILSAFAQAEVSILTGH